MNVDELYVRLAETVAAVRAAPSSTSYLVRGDDLATGDVGRIAFERGLAAEVLGDVLGYAEGMLQREFIPYDPSYQLGPHQALVDELGEVPELRRVHGLLPRADDDHPDRGPVRAIVHRVSSAPGTALTAYRTKGHGIATRAATGVLALVPRDGVYERVPSEILYYEPRFDALVVGEHVFVTAIMTLQRAFGSSQRASTMARQTFEHATARIAIDGADELLAAVSSEPAMVAKMAQLARTLEAEPEYAEVLTTERLLAFLDANPHIPILTAGDGADRRLVFESSPQKRWLIVKALADDFLRSELSHRTYEVGSKSRIAGQRSARRVAE